VTVVPAGPVLILGAGSDIARMTARAFAAKGHAIQLAARDPERLAADRDDLTTRYGVAVSLHPFDALAIETHAAFVEQLPELPAIAVCAVGTLGDHAASIADPLKAAVVIRTNFEGPASVLACLANAMSARGSGTLVGISSVAGERGRQSNYVYGSAKAGFTAFLSGLRNRLAPVGVHVVTVKPGFVATAMTEGLDLPERLTAKPEEVAEAIVAAVDRRRNTIYVRPVWRLIMAIVRNVPEPIFKKTKM
jgi:short-subunit dehydrogenase